MRLLTCHFFKAMDKIMPGIYINREGANYKQKKIQENLNIHEGDNKTPTKILLTCHDSLAKF
jgi:hypothetical protein